MSSSFSLIMSLLVDLVTFKQKSGESFKEAWDGILELHQKIQPMLAVYVLLRCFYFGLFEEYKHALDVMVGGSFVEYDEIKYLHIIDGLAAFPMNTKIDEITDRLGKI